MSQTQRFVRLDSQYFEVIMAEDGFRLRPIDAHAYMAAQIEKTVLGNEALGLAEDDDNVMQQVIDEVREDFKKTLKAGIKETVLRSLGFEKDSWGTSGFKVDHCNGRMSSVTELIKQEVKDHILNAKIGIDFIITEEEKAELKEAMRADFAQQYLSHIRREMYSAVDNLAKQDMKAVATELLGSQKKEIANKVLETLLTKKKK